MGRDHSFSDDFPSVEINGEKFRYGRDFEYGQYMVENAENAKDYWCFDRRDDLMAFLVNLPESAGELSCGARNPDWAEISSEERHKRIEEHHAFLRNRMEEKRTAGTDKWFNVMRFDDAGHYCVNASPQEMGTFDDLSVVIKTQDVKDQQVFVVELKPEHQYGDEEKTVLRISRSQALRLASVLADAVSYIEAQAPRE